MRSPFAALFAMAPLVVAVPSHADNRPRLELVYETRADDHCLSVAAFRRAVDERLGYHVWVDAAADSLVRVTMSRHGAEMRAEIVLERSGGTSATRTIRAHWNDCEELSKAAAIAVSIAVEEGMATPPPPAAGATSPQLPTPTAPAASRPPPNVTPPLAPAEPVEPVEPVQPRRGTEVEVAPRPYGAVGAVGAFLSQPRFALGPAVEIGLLYKRVSLAVGGQLEWAAGPAMMSGEPISSALWFGSVVPCWRPLPFVVCADASLGRWSASTPTEARGQLWSSAGVRLGGEFAMTSALALRISMDARAALVRPAILLDGRTVWQHPGVISFGPSIRLVVKIP